MIISQGKNAYFSHLYIVTPLLLYEVNRTIQAMRFYIIIQATL